MKMIAHRANLNGPNLLTENSPEQIQHCIENGVDVEIDVRYDPKTERLWLGHDEPQYPVTWWWLAGRSEHLWIHCKDITTLHTFTNATSGYNYFWHQEDDFTLTSKQYIWTYPGKPYTSKSVIVMPEWNEPNWDTLRVTNCYGICTDYVEKLR
jgi:hypothetical protein